MPVGVGGQGKSEESGAWWEQVQVGIWTRINKNWLLENPGKITVTWVFNGEAWGVQVIVEGLREPFKKRAPWGSTCCQQPKCRTAIHLFPCHNLIRPWADSHPGTNQLDNVGEWFLKLKQQLADLVFPSSFSCGTSLCPSWSVRDNINNPSTVSWKGSSLEFKNRSHTEWGKLCSPESLDKCSGWERWTGWAEKVVVNEEEASAGVMSEQVITQVGNTGGLEVKAPEIRPLCD